VQETTKEGMKQHVEHLMLKTEHPVHGRKTNFLYEGMSVTIGRYTPEELGKKPREHIQINDPEGVVSRNHGEISFENGRIFYKDHSTNGTEILDSKGNLIRKVQNEEVELHPSNQIKLPNGTILSFAMEIRVTEPAKVQPKKNELEEIVKTAGSRNAEVLKTFIEHVSELIEKEKEAGRLRMGVDSKLKNIQGGMWVEGSLVHLPREGNAILVGDIHSRFNCLEHILKETNFVDRVRNGEKLYIVFMGDFVDRPAKEGEVMKVLETVLALKSKFPNNVVILAGNHDVAKEGSIAPQEFPNEVKIKYGKDGEVIMEKYRKLFESMPIAVKMENGVFVTHGGAASSVRSLADVTHPSKETKVQMLWNDPNSYTTGYSLNKQRGFSEFGEDKAFVFGADALNEFLNSVGSKVMVRAHEQDVRHDFNNKCLTLNSTDYKNSRKAYAVVNLSEEITSTSQIQLHYF